MFINQIFELSMTVKKEQFRKLLKEKYNVKSYEADEEEYIDQSLASDGIMVIYCNKQCKKKVKMAADLKFLMGEEKKDTYKLIRRLDKYIGKYFNYRYKLCDFTLSGMILAVDIDVHTRDDVESYIKVLHRLNKVKGYSQVYFDCLDDSESFCLEGNSNGIQFMMYDMEKLMKKQAEKAGAKRKKMRSIISDAQGIIRAEVHLAKSKAITKYTDAIDVSGQIIELSNKCQKIFLDVFAKVVPFGDFYKKSKAMEIIHRDIKDSIMRRKMLHLLALIPEKKSLYLAQKSMNCRNMEKVMDAFAKINLSPVTISKRHGIKYLGSLYAYLM